MHPAEVVDLEPAHRRALRPDEVLDDVQHGVMLHGRAEDAAPARIGRATRARKMPATARLSDSVPPEVKITSLGRAPSASAMDSLDSSTRRRASRPEVCSDEALPVADIASVIAATTSGSTGVVAA